MTPPAEKVEHATLATSEVSAPLTAKILIVSTTVPPLTTGSAVIVANLMAKLEPGTAVAVGEGREPMRFVHGHAVHFFRSEPGWATRGRRFIRWTRWARFRSLVRFIDRISKENGRGPIVAVFPDEMQVAAARTVAKRHGLPFFPYFHNTYTDNRRGLARLFGRRIERRIIEAGDRVLVLTSALGDLLKSRYPEATYDIVPHSFAFAGNHTDIVRAPDETIRIGILGNINESNMDAFLRLFRALDDSMFVTLYSGSTPSWFFEKLGVLGPRVRHEQPSDADLLGKLRENDILYLPHGLNGRWGSAEYRTIFPTRTAPYMGSGRPVLAHIPQQSFLYDWLHQRDCAEIVTTPSENDLRAAIHRLATDGRRSQQIVQNAAAAFLEFDPERVSRYFKRIVTGGKS